jgi:DNA-binding transcriptional ArsR family regulator
MAKKTVEQEWVETLKALADQTRLRMVRVLIDGSKSVGELAESLEISPYNASKHLRVLRGVGIVEVSQSGTRRECAIAANFRKRDQSGARARSGVLRLPPGAIGQIIPTIRKKPLDRNVRVCAYSQSRI